MQEGTLTWSLQRNSLPLPALRAQGPSGRIALWRLIFASLFFVCFFHIFLINFDLHCGTMLASFSMFFALLFRASILDGTVIIFARFVCDFWIIFVDFHGPTSNWRKPQKHLCLHYFCIIYTFANTCFLIIFETCFATVCLHHLLLYFAPILASFWHDFGIKTWAFSIQIF